MKTFFFSSSTELSTSFNSTQGQEYRFTSSTHTSSLDAKAFFLLKSYFFSMKQEVPSLLHSYPASYHHTPTKVHLTVMYYMAEDSELNSVSTTKLSWLSDALTKVYGKEVRLIFIRNHYPYQNSSILAQYLAHNSSTNTFVHFSDSILTYPSLNVSQLPSYITGIKIELSGRLITEPVVPRITKKTAVFGTFSKVVDYAKYTTKNELGAFTIKV
ncbi:MAG: hypothetical protein EOP34_04670 [Rickettsiales bacterium]|nr:MAG: hypothetical protein EOP34_04670 [Rickettsiales bacterium]